MALYRATFHAAWFSAVYNNVVHFTDLVGQGQPPVECRIIAQDLVANWIEFERQFHQASYQWNSVSVVEIRNPNPMPSHIEAVNKVGSGTTQAHSSSCIKIRWLTNRGGRRGFGKYYMGGINWAMIGNGNTISTTSMTNLLGWLAGLDARYMQTDNAIVPFKMVLVHKDVNDAPNDIINSQVYPVLGVQRRRKIGTPS